MLLQSSWQSASLQTVVEKALAAHCPEHRRKISGDDLVINSKRALSLALALHELATNAIKYGALSNDEGCVHIDWATENGELCLTWTESGGPAVAAPKQTGFGTRMITRNLASEFKGDVDMNYKASGIVLTLKAPA